MGIEQRVNNILSRQITRRRFLDVAVFGAADLALGMAGWQGYKAAAAGNDADNARGEARLLNPPTENIFYIYAGPGRFPVLDRSVPRETPTPLPIEKQREIKRERQRLDNEAETHEENYYKHVVLTVLSTVLGLLIGGPRFLNKEN